MFHILLPHVLTHLFTHLSFIVTVVMSLFGALGQTSDPLGEITSLLSTLNSYFTGSQLSNIENQVFGQQESATAFAQSPEKMGQFFQALQSPYALSQFTNPQQAQNFQNYLQQFQNQYGNVATPGTAATANQYNQAFQTPYQAVLNQQQAAGTPQTMGSLENQYTQGLNAALTSNVWNQVQGQLGQSGMTQAPGVAAYNYAQALAPYYQQNVQLGAQQAQQPFNWLQQQQQYGLQAGQQPLQYGLAEQQYGISAAGMPLNYQAGINQQTLQEAQNALQYPFNIGSQLAGAFPNYSTAYSPGTTP